MANSVELEAAIVAYKAMRQPIADADALYRSKLQAKAAADAAFAALFSGNPSNETIGNTVKAQERAAAELALAEADLVAKQQTRANHEANARFFARRDEGV